MKLGVFNKSAKIAVTPNADTDGADQTSSASASRPKVSIQTASTPPLDPLSDMSSLSMPSGPESPSRRTRIKTFAGGDEASSTANTIATFEETGGKESASKERMKRNTDSILDDSCIANSLKMRL